MPETNASRLDGWVRDTWPGAVAYARSLLRDAAAAEDVVQDCYVALLKKADDYDLVRDGAKLLMKSVSNACLKRKQRARPTLGLDGPHEADGAPGPPRALLGAELGRHVAEALLALPPTQRAAVELKALGHSLNEIAEILGVSATNAGVLVHRGRQELARRLAPYLEDAP